MRSFQNKTVNDIQKAVDRITTFPSQVTEAPLVTQVDSGILPVMELTLSGDMEYKKLHSIAEEIITLIERQPGAKSPLKESTDIKLKKYG